MSLGIQDAVFKLKVDNSEAKAKNEEFRESETNKTRQLVTFARRASTLINGLTAAGFLGLNQVYTLAIEAGARTVEFLTVNAAAISLSNPMGIIAGAASIVSIGNLIGTIVALEQGNQEVAMARLRTSAVANILTAW